MEYNSARNVLVMKEYGRNVQNLIDLAIAEPDREKRNRMVKSIIDVMGSLKYQRNPHQVLDNFEINIADFSPGMYYIIVEDVHHNFKKSIFVKM